MKLSLLLLLVAFGATCFGQSKLDTLNIKTRIICDHCKTCETCGLKFEKDIYLSHGIKNSTFNSGDTTIMVVYRKNRTDPETIRLLISKMGFDADHIPADPKGFEKLDDCCRPGIEEN